MISEAPDPLAPQSSLALPDAVKDGLSAFLAPDESILHFCECDLLPSGEFGEAWLIATDHRFALYRRDGARSGLTIDLPLELCQRLEMRELQGTVLVEAITPERMVVLARLTQEKREGLDRALPGMRALLPESDTDGAEGKTWEGDGKPTKDVCPKCGRPLPSWSGTCVQCLEKRKLMLRLMVRVKSYWPYVMLGLVTMVMMQAADLVQPWFQAVLIDHAIKGRDLRLLWRLIFWIIGLNVVSQVIGGFRSYLMAWFGQKAIYDLRSEMYEHIQRLSVAFYDSKQTGWIMDRVTSDTSNLQDFLTDALQDFIRDSTTLVCILVILLKWNWQLAVLTLLPTPLIGLASYVFMKRAHRLWHRVWRKRSLMASLLTDVVPGVRVVKAFAAEDRETGKFNQRNREYMDSSVDAARIFAVFGPTTGLLATSGFMVIWAYGGYEAIVHPSTLSVGALVAFMMYLWRFYQPVQNLSRMTQRIQWAATAAQRVFEVLDTDPDIQDPADAREMPRIVGRVEFDNVTFGYDPHNPVLKGVSFTAEPGEMIGLVGPSGAGKSTTINLVSRFYDVLEGALRIDGIDVRDVTLSSLRNQIGVVLQEPFLFHGTLADNIAYGNPAATRKQIIRAAKAANCHEFILRFPEGYDTVVGERGTRLSGGERQRISIARAILKDPRILILDEATSSVDTETEGQIRQALERLVKGRTTFAIAHRFSTLRHADRLVVLDQGKLVEIGTHQELMAREDGLFRKLCDQQRYLSEIVAVGG